MATYVERVIEECKKNNPGEPEFHQTVEEVLTSLAGSSTLVQPKTKFFNLATHWKMGFFYEIFCQI